MEKQFDEIFCPHCAKPIKKDFTICPYCRNEIINIESKEFEPIKKDIKDKPKKKTNFGAIVGIIVSIIIVITFLVLCNIDPSKNTPTTESEQSKQVRAFVYSQSVCEKNLKAPATAKFPMITNSNVHVDKLAIDKYQVVAFVDSENSFGALVRANYIVTIIFTGEDTYSWENFQLIE